MNPTLPPKAGYIEVEINGARQYQKIPTEQDAEIEALKAENAALNADNLATMEALAEVYELMTGGTA